MKLATALAFTGNEYQAMTYEQLVEVTKAMAEAARRRIRRTPQGPAYERLKRRALGEGRTVRANALSYRDHTIKISQKFKGKNKMSMQDLRTLRKELYTYLKDPTSTEKGFRELREAEERMIQERNTPVEVPEEWGMEDMSIYNMLDLMETDTDLIHFGQEFLGWDVNTNGEGGLKETIIASGGYGHINTAQFRENIRALLRAQEEEQGLPMYDFMYPED